MRVIFMGTPHFAVVSLSKLLAAGVDIAAVVTVPDKPAGRGLHLHTSPVKYLALQHNLPVLQPDDLKDPDFISALTSYNANLFVVVAFRILPEEVFTIPPLGTINLHASLLPRYRGAAPINWAIINGESETGVTTFYIRKAVDTGNIIDTVKVEIGPLITAGELHDILAEKGGDLLVRTIYAIEQRRAKKYIQNEALATKAPRLNKEDCRINFDQPVQRVHNFIRGLSPHPSAYTFWQGKLIRMFATRIYELQKKTRQSGEIVDMPKQEKLIIQCTPGWLEVGEVQLEGKRQMPVEEFLNGHTMKVGERFGE